MIQKRVPIRYDAIAIQNTFHSMESFVCLTTEMDLRTKNMTTKVYDMFIGRGLIEANVNGGKMKEMFYLCTNIAMRMVVSTP